MAFFFLVTYLITFFVRPHEWPILANENSPIIRACLLLCMSFFVFTRNKNFQNPQLLLLFLLTFAVLISHITSGWVGGAVVYGQEFIQTALIPFILVSGLVSSVKKQYVVFTVIICASLLMVVNGHVQVNSEDGLGLFGNPVTREGTVSRITYLGYLSDPNDLGMFLVMTLPAAVLIKEKAPPFIRIVLWVAIVALLYGIYLTNSRGTLLATMALAAFWFWQKYGRSKSILVGLLASPVLLIVFSSFRTISAEDESSQGRLEAWYAGYQMFASNPLFGVGQQSFIDNYEAHTAHNSFVLVMAELGLFGALAWVGLLVFTTISLINISKKNFLHEGVEIKSDVLLQLDNEAFIAKALLYCFIAFMVTGFFLSRSYTSLLFIYIGMAAASMGRLNYLLPDNITVIDIKQAAKYTFLFTFSSIFAIYALLKVFL